MPPRPPPAGNSEAPGLLQLLSLRARLGDLPCAPFPGHLLPRQAGRASTDHLPAPVTPAAPRPRERLQPGALAAPQRRLLRVARPCSPAPASHGPPRPGLPRSPRADPRPAPGAPLPAPFPARPGRSRFRRRGPRRAKSRRKKRPRKPPRPRSPRSPQAGPPAWGGTRRPPAARAPAPARPEARRGAGHTAPAARAGIMAAAAALPGPGPGARDPGRRGLPGARAGAGRASPQLGCTWGAARAAARRTHSPALRRRQACARSSSVCKTSPRAAGRAGAQRGPARGGGGGGLRPGGGEAVLASVRPCARRAPAHFLLLTARAAPANMAVPHPDPAAVYHPYIGRARGRRGGRKL